MNKCQELTNEDSVLNKSKDDEPLFILVARDGTAPTIVIEWITEAYRSHVDEAKIDAAWDLLKTMVKWQAENGCFLPG